MYSCQIFYFTNKRYWKLYIISSFSISPLFINLQWGAVNFNAQKVEKIVTYPLALTERPFVIVAMSNSQHYPSWFAVELNSSRDFTLIPQGQAGWTGYFILGK